MTTDMLSVKGGTKIFYRGTQDERRALDGLDITLKPADFCVVIGSNGAGKSSFLNAVSGKMPLNWAVSPSMARMSPNSMRIAVPSSLPAFSRTR